MIFILSLQKDIYKLNQKIVYIFTTTNNTLIYDINTNFTFLPNKKSFHFPGW